MRAWRGGACIVCVSCVVCVCATVAMTMNDLAVAVDLGLTDAAQAAQMSTELQRLQQLRERQVSADFPLFFSVSLIRLWPGTDLGCCVTCGRGVEVRVGRGVSYALKF